MRRDDINEATGDDFYHDLQKLLDEHSMQLFIDGGAIAFEHTTDSGHKEYGSLGTALSIASVFKIREDILRKYVKRRGETLDSWSAEHPEQEWIRTLAQYMERNNLGPN